MPKQAKGKKPRGPSRPTPSQETKAGIEVAAKRPTVSIIGIGRVGTAMSWDLQCAGYPLVARVFHEWRGQEDSQALYPETLRLDAEQLDQLPESDLLLITTPDDAIAETARKVATLQNGDGRRVVLHTSGALSSEVLSPLAKAGFLVGSMHPLVALTYGAGLALQGVSFCVEGHPAAVALAEDIVRDFGGECFSIETEQKALYHAAAVMASPHLVALFDLALQLLANTGLEREDAHKILLGLVDSTVKNLNTRQPSGPFYPTSWTLTGTFARGDVGTVERHLKALSQGRPKPPPEALEIYKLLGLRSLQMAKSTGLDPRKISKITKLLKTKTPKP
jgi:predicted short-subunit dehydrogenase-like oxidoreductase (DUF2520 family)